MYYNPSICTQCHMRLNGCSLLRTLIWCCDVFVLCDRLSCYLVCESTLPFTSFAFKACTCTFFMFYGNECTARLLYGYTCFLMKKELTFSIKYCSQLHGLDKHEHLYTIVHITNCLYNYHSLQYQLCRYYNQALPVLPNKLRKLL